MDDLNAAFGKRKTRTSEFDVSAKAAKTTTADAQQDSTTKKVHNKSSASAATTHNSVKIREAKCVNTSARLCLSFYDRSCVELAKMLLGKKLLRQLPCGDRLSGLIVETEAYLGGDDKASHSFNGRKTARNASMFMPAGTAYVYNIYGIYTCLNISSREAGAAVLLRALHPVQGIDRLRSLRGSRLRDKGSNLKLHQLCNGPSKLTMALQIDRATIDGLDMCSSEKLWVEENDGEGVGEDWEVSGERVIACKRVGVESAGEDWAGRSLRFYMKDSPSVSVRDRQAERAGYTGVT